MPSSFPFNGVRVHCQAMGGAVLWFEPSKAQQEGGSPTYPGCALIEPFRACLRCLSVCKHTVPAVPLDKTIHQKAWWQMTNVKRGTCIIPVMILQASIKHGEDLFWSMTTWHFPRSWSMADKARVIITIKRFSSPLLPQKQQEPVRTMNLEDLQK